MTLYQRSNRELEVTNMNPSTESYIKQKLKCDRGTNSRVDQTEESVNSMTGYLKINREEKKNKENIRMLWNNV